MNFLVWNVRGFNRSSIQNEIKCKITLLRLAFVGPVEPKASFEKLQATRNSFLPQNWNDFANDSVGGRALIWICWSPSVRVDNGYNLLWQQFCGS